MSIRLARLAAVLLVVVGSAGLCGFSQAAPLSGPSSPAAASSCPPAFLMAPFTPAPIPASPAVCACGDTACNGHIAGTSCGTFRVCVQTGGCTFSASKQCACVTQDPAP